MRRLIIMRILIRNNWMGYYKKLKYTQTAIRIKINRIMKIQKKQNDTQEMKIENPEEEIKLDDDEDKYDNFINK